MSDGFRVNTDRMSDKSQDFRRQSAQIGDIAQRIISCKNQLQLNTASSVMLKLQIERLHDQALTNAAQMDSLADALDQIAQLYIACENRVVGNANGTPESGGEYAEEMEEGTDKRGWWQKFWDWLWGKDVDTRYTHTTSEQEAAADAHMQNQIQDLLNSDRYSEETWANASVEERKQILEDFMNEVADILGVDVDDTFAYLNQAPENGMTTNGWYSHSSRSVAINMYIVENGSPERSYQLMTTVVHELRHAYQHAAVDNPTRFQVSQETIDAWKDSFDNYRDTGDFMDDYGMSRQEAYDAYRNQDVERDARWFAGQD